MLKQIDLQRRVVLNAVKIEYNIEINQDGSVT